VAGLPRRYHFTNCCKSENSTSVDIICVSGARMTYRTEVWSDPALDDIVLVAVHAAVEDLACGFDAQPWVVVPAAVVLRLSGLGARLAQQRLLPPRHTLSCRQM
jgi:hypothetical protein